jgi:hypothetical protein
MEILLGTNSPVKHKIFWQGEIRDADSNPVVKLFDITEDPAVNPAINPITILETLNSVKLENDIGTYVVYIPFEYTNRHRELRLSWIYNVDGVTVFKDHKLEVVTPYTDIAQSMDVLGVGTDPSDPNYKTYDQLLEAERYARKEIEAYTGQKFSTYDNVYVTNGYGSDTLPLPEKITELHELYANDILLLDNINEINNWNHTVEISTTGYGIRVNRANSLDNTVYTANGMVPPSIHDSNGIFQDNVSYKVQGRFGWNEVPDEVELACIELMKDYFSKDKTWRNKYIKNISTFDWDFEYTSEAYAGTGNAYADRLLSDYVMVSKVQVI